MKKLIVLTGLLIVLGVSCKKQDMFADKQIQPGAAQKRPACGMEEAMANLSPEMRDAITAGAVKTEAQAAEILLYLKFDGAFVRRGFPNPTGLFSPIISFSAANCPAPSLSAQQVQEIVNLVVDDFSPFNIVVTTDQGLFNSYPSGNKQICIITTLPSVVGMSSGTGGVAPFSGLGIRLPFNPSFVFATLYAGDAAAIAGVISHESAHTMGLGHQHQFGSECNYLFEYHSAFGTGLLSFAPIMGQVEQGRVTNWFAQSCFSPVFGSPQNDFTLLTSQVILREDDFPDEQSDMNIATSREVNGILEEAGDTDFILINFKNPGPVTVSSENIDLKVSVYNFGGHLLSEHNDPGDTGVTIESVNGKRFLKIEAAGNANMSAQFMTGQYRISY